MLAVPTGGEKPKLQSGTETALISGGDGDGGESEDTRARAHTHTVTPLGNVWVLQRGNPWNRQLKLGQNRRARTLARARGGP